MGEHLAISLRITAILLLITCALYPALVWGIGRTLFSHQADGSLIVRNGTIVGSELIGQKFSSRRWFHSRPSAAGADGYDGAASGGSNLGPTSTKLRDAIAKAVNSADHTPGVAVPADAVTASASGLDPHISPANAFAQASRVAQENGVPVEVVRSLIGQHTKGRWLGVYGEPRVNVLALNLAVRELRGR